MFLSVRLTISPPAGGASWPDRGGQPSRPPRAFSPDADALLGRDVELLARLDVPGLVPAGDVPDGAVDPIVGGRVRVADHLLAQGVVAALLAPHLGPAEEDALV